MGYKCITMRCGPVGRESLRDIAEFRHSRCHHLNPSSPDVVSLTAEERFLPRKAIWLAPFSTRSDLPPDGTMIPFRGTTIEVDSRPLRNQIGNHPMLRMGSYD